LAAMLLRPLIRPRSLQMGLFWTLLMGEQGDRASTAIAQGAGLADGELPPDMMKSAVGKKPMRLTKSEPYLKCEVCRLATEHIWSEVEAAAKASPYGKIGEIEIGRMVDSICDADDDLGDWITYLDIVQDKPSEPLELKKQEYLGECRRECTTLAHACKVVFEEHREDMTEMLYKHWRPKDADTRASKQQKSLTAERLTSRVCKKLSKACPGKDMPKSFEHKDEIWMPADEEGLKMRKMQHAINKQSQETGSQPVQFLDPMGPGSMFGMDDEEL